MPTTTTPTTTGGLCAGNGDEATPANVQQRIMLPEECGWGRVEGGGYT